jgi:HTH-type transcriptional regulator / antitoxin HigA
MSTVVSDSYQRHYLGLVRTYPLRPIRSEKELDAAIRRIDALLDKPRRNRAEEDYLEVLGNLVERYETEKNPEEPVSDAAMLRHLLDARAVPQVEVARVTGIANSTISAVLHGNRSLSRDHIGRLATYFHVAPGVFAFGGR